MATSTKITINDSTATQLAVGLKSIVISSGYGFLIGGSGVTHSSGFPIPGGVAFPIALDLGALEGIYGLAPDGSPDIDVNVLNLSVM